MLLKEKLSSQRNLTFQDEYLGNTWYYREFLILGGHYNKYAPVIIFSKWTEDNRNDNIAIAYPNVELSSGLTDYIRRERKRDGMNRQVYLLNGKVNGYFIIKTKRYEFFSVNQNIARQTILKKIREELRLKRIK